MTPTAVLTKSITTNTTMNSSAPNTLTNNALSLSNGNNGPTSFYFCVYQQILVGSGDVSVRTLVPAAISAAPYRKALIAKIFFRQILALTDTSSVSFSDLMSTVTAFSFLFLICRVLDSPMLLGSLLQSQTRTISPQILLILLSAS